MSLVVPGWCCMVTGQSVVLYSRLHIVMRNPSRLRLVLIMIITNAFIGHVPTAVFAYGANTPNPGPFIIPYSIYERVQVTLFFLQEMVISALYIHETVGLMRVRRRANMDSSRQGSGKRRLLMAHLVVVNVLIVVLDITILGLEYAGLYAVQTAYKGFVYSVKLKLEFSILNRLVEMTQGGSSSGHESSYARTAADMSGVRMEKLDGDSTDRERKKNRRSVAAADLNNSLGNNVFVGVGAGGPAVAGAEEARHNGASVVMTTEVTIQRDRLYLESDVEADRESLGGRSGVTEDSIVGGNGGQARAPSHSSQRHIVDERYS
ncbi:hypothetical protein N658DRAFT_426071 [Parathielavia hyrcaniae]|uniref:DUF7703 domain-containing protein n=1 Tax=Parathielavia hyrcaniae TaxID=113614 RepID=A0AAN6Q0G9_9PEZI|nr:hypothetical protein N658DRAFT_426071 [Parathielavia hyrcaniae]